MWRKGQVAKFNPDLLIEEIVAEVENLLGTRNAELKEPIIIEWKKWTEKEGRFSSEGSPLQLSHCFSQ